MLNKSYEVVVIGSGPIGTSCCEYLVDNGINVLNIFTESNLPLSINSKTGFEPSIYSLITSGETGLSQFWGNAHDLPRNEKYELGNYKQIKILSNLNWPNNIQFNESKINEFVKKISANKYPIGYYFVKKNNTIKNQKFKKIQVRSIKWYFKSDSWNFSIEYENENGITNIIYADYIILAAGTLGNALLLHLNREIKNSKTIFHGYTNHPKYVSHTFELKFPKRFHKKYHDLLWTKTNLIELLEHNKLRASVRVWPIAKSVADRIILKFGYARKFQTMVYLRVPSLEENYLEVNHKEIAVHFKLPKDYLEIYEVAIKEFGEHLKSLNIMKGVTKSNEQIVNVLTKDSNHHMSALKKIADENLQINRKIDSGVRKPYVVGVGTIDSDVNHPTWIAAIESIKVCDEIIYLISKKQK